MQVAFIIDTFNSKGIITSTIRQSPSALALPEFIPSFYYNAGPGKAQLLHFCPHKAKDY